MLLCSCSESVQHFSSLSIFKSRRLCQPERRKTHSDFQKKMYFFSKLILILETKYVSQSKGKRKASYHLGIMQSMKSHFTEESPWEIKKYLASGPLQTVQDHHPAVLYKWAFTCKSATIKLIFVSLTLILSPLLNEGLIPLRPKELHACDQTQNQGPYMVWMIFMFWMTLLSLPSQSPPFFHRSL